MKQPVKQPSKYLSRLALVINRNNIHRARLAAEGLTVKYLQLDVTSTKSIQAAKKTIEYEEGHLDVLVNNAGTATARIIP